MRTDLLKSVAAGLTSALFYASVLSGSFSALILVWLAPAPLFYAGLTMHVRGAIIAAAAGMLVIGVAGDPATALAYALSNAVAPIILCRFALLSRSYTDNSGPPRSEWYPSGLLFGVLGIIASLFVLGLVIFSLGQPEGLRGFIETLLDIDGLTATITQMQAQTGDAVLDEALLRATLPAIALLSLVCGWQLSMIASAAVAQAVAQRFGPSLRPSPTLVDLQLPRWINFAFLGGILGTFLPGTAGFAASAIAAIFALPYFFLGLSTVHVISRRLPARPFVLTVFYVFMIFFSWLILLTVGLGLTEQFAGFRQKAIAARTGQGQGD